MPKKLSDHTKATRQKKIYNVLRHITDEETAMTTSEVHKRLEDDNFIVSRKQVERDLKEMEGAHLLFYTDTTPVKYFCNEDYEPDYQLTFQESELKTIALALNALSEMSDHFQRTLCEKTEEILLSKLPKELAKEFEKLKSYTVVSPPFRSVVGMEDSESYRKVLRALKDGKVIRCQNHSPYKDQAYREVYRTFSPIKLNMVGSEQYLFAQDHADKEIKRLKICRLKNMSILEEKIDQSLVEKFDDLASSIGGYGGPGTPVTKYAIHCNELMAILFEEKKMHPSQKVQKKGKEYIITFEANPSVEVSRYLSGWAEYITHVEPPEVFDEMKKIWDAGNGLKPGKKAA